MFPCGLSTKPVKANKRGIQFATCDIWFHTRCLHMCSEVYNGLANSSAVWICRSCGMCNDRLINVGNLWLHQGPFGHGNQQENAILKFSLVDMVSKGTF